VPISKCPYSAFLLLQKLGAGFGAALAKVIAEFKAEGERSIRKIKDRVEAARLKRAVESHAAELRRTSARLRQGTEQTAAPSDPAGSSEEIREGDRVRIQSLDREGIVESICEDAFVVRVGPLRCRADRTDLARTAERAVADLLIPIKSHVYVSWPFFQLPWKSSSFFSLVQFPRTTSWKQGEIHKSPVLNSRAGRSYALLFRFGRGHASERR
jgi:hypothetical protein